MELRLVPMAGPGFAGPAIGISLNSGFLILYQVFRGSEQGSFDKSLVYMEIWAVIM